VLQRLTDQVYSRARLNWRYLHLADALALADAGNDGPLQFLQLNSDETLAKATRPRDLHAGHMKTTRDDPEQVEGNVIFTFLDAFELDEAKVCELKAHCRRVNVSNSAQPAAR
jgi:hypothetical protein